MVENVEQDLGNGDNNEELHQTEWKLAAMVVDRFLLILFYSVTIVVSVVILVHHPDYSNVNYKLPPNQD